ncbi:unnamed protein product [Urochloa humidicola]
MSEGSSLAARSRVAAPPDRVWQSSPAPPLEVVPAPVVDDVTGLPLILCPKCKILGRHLRLVAFTCGWTKNRGRRYFKCPRNEVWVANRCDIIMVKEQYE